MKVEYHTRSASERLAYIYTESSPGVQLPPVLFLGGYRSDMSGTKAGWLGARMASRGQAYVRFDYSGHGQSEGAFEDGTIGAWMDDALAILEQVVKRKAILVGSSMGGWMALLLARARPALVHALVGIAAAPDFTEEIYASLTEAQKAELNSAGIVRVPNDYSDIPYTYTKDFYEEAKAHLLLREKRRVDFPVRLVQGKKDLDVPWRTALEIERVYQSPDMKVVFIEDGDHRLSREQDLEIIDAQIRNLSAG
ncbi:MAG: alpha/beta hydrolase [Alphaproteobacteria bacterium]